MKIKFVFLMLLSLIIIGMVGCENKLDELIWEIYVDSDTSVIEKEINGINFKYSLLNAQGQPATVFNEYENFSFHLSVTNKTKEKLYFFPDFAYQENNGFCEIFSSKNETRGKAFTFLGYDKIGIGAYPFEIGDSVVFEQPWVDNRDSVWRWKYGYYQSNYQESLPSDNYFTKFSSIFQFKHENTGAVYLSTNIIFKINLSIKNE